MGPEKALVGSALSPEGAECSGTLSVKQLVGVAPELFFYARSEILDKRSRGGGEGSPSLRHYPSRVRRQAPTTPSKPVPSKTKLEGSVTVSPVKLNAALDGPWWVMSVPIRSQSGANSELRVQVCKSGLNGIPGGRIGLAAESQRKFPSVSPTSGRKK
jgi:hypothetical protein